jgi:hypothetical protein
MEAYQDRVITERDELSEKINKLRTFLGGSVFSTLSIEERRRMTMQYLAMAAYRDALNERIHAFGNSHAS